ncbi:MAG: cache domain-containing protein, partial [Myxococcota bacterium]
MRFPLQLKILFGFALTLLPLVILTIREFRSDVARLERRVLEAQMITAGGVAAAVDRQLDTAIGLGWAVSLDPRVKRFDPVVVEAYLQELVQLTPFVTAIGVFDAQGECHAFATSTGIEGRGPSIGDRAYFQQVMAANQPAVSNVLALRTLPGTGIVAAVPIRDDTTGRAVGLVAVITDTHALSRQYWERSTQAPGQAILLLDRDGRLAFHTADPDLPFEMADAMRAFPPVVSALAGVPATSASFTSPIAGDERLGAFTRTSTHDWVVGVTVPREIALAPAYRHLRSELLAFGIILGFTILLSVGFARFLVRPVRELQAAVRDLGRGDLSRRVAIRTGDEIEALAASFNKIT